MGNNDTISLIIKFKFDLLDITLYLREDSKLFYSTSDLCIWKPEELTHVANLFVDQTPSPLSKLPLTVSS